VGRRGLIIAALALALAGCGPTPPQAPGPQAHALNESLSGISTACGHAAEVQAFTDDAGAMAALERQAAKQVDVLAAVYHRNPAWIFQSKSVRDLVVMTNTYLDECGLHGAAARLRRLTSG
jgi:hypothetical protein